MFVFQLILVLFFFFAMYKVIVRYRKKEIAIGITLVWCFLWSTASVVALYPNSTAIVARWFGVGRGADLVVYVSLAALFFVFFRIMVTVEKQSREITALTRAIAILKAENKTLSSGTNDTKQE